MKYILEYSRKSIFTLDKLKKKTAKRIILKLEYFISRENPLSYAKKLTGRYSDLYRFRVGDYRLIFSKDIKGKITILTIIQIGSRKDVYKN